MYALSISDAIRRSLEKLPRKLQERLLRSAYGLANDPRPAGCTKLSGSRDLYRVRVGDTGLSIASTMPSDWSESLSSHIAATSIVAFRVAQEVSQ